MDHKYLKSIVGVKYPIFSSLSARSFEHLKIFLAVTVTDMRKRQKCKEGFYSGYVANKYIAEKKKINK